MGGAPCEGKRVGGGAYSFIGGTCCLGRAALAVVVAEAIWRSVGQAAAAHSQQRRPPGSANHMTLFNRIRDQQMCSLLPPTASQAEPSSAHCSPSSLHCSLLPQQELATIGICHPAAAPILLSIIRALSYPLSGRQYVRAGLSPESAGGDALAATALRAALPQGQHPAAGEGRGRAGRAHWADSGQLPQIAPASAS